MTNDTRPKGRRKSLLLLLAVGLVLVLATGAYLHLTFSHPVGTGPAGPDVPREAFSNPWSERPVLFVGLGDSVTFGFGARKGRGYFDLVANNPTEEDPRMAGVCLSSVFPKLLITNLSVSGTTSFELADTQLPQVPCSDTQTLGWVVITTGGNDLIHNYGKTPPRAQAMYGATWEQAKPWIEDFERRLEKIVAGLSTKFPGGSHIFLANIYDPTDGVGDIERAGLPAWSDGLRVMAAYNDVISRCAEKHSNVHVVNMLDAFRGHGIHCAQFWFRHYDSRDPHYWYYTNLEDPNERGYDALRRLFLLEMIRVAKGLK